MTVASVFFGRRTPNSISNPIFFLLPCTYCLCYTSAVLASVALHFPVFNLDVSAVRLGGPIIPSLARKSVKRGSAILRRRGVCGIYERGQPFGLLYP